MSAHAGEVYVYSSLLPNRNVSESVLFASSFSMVFGDYANGRIVYLKYLSSYALSAINLTTGAETKIKTLTTLSSNDPYKIDDSSFTTEDAGIKIYNLDGNVIQTAGSNINAFFGFIPVGYNRTNTQSKVQYAIYDWSDEMVFQFNNSRTGTIKTKLPYNHAGKMSNNTIWYSDYPGMIAGGYLNTTQLAKLISDGAERLIIGFFSALFIIFMTIIA
jgi:hypothetical protein